MCFFKVLSETLQWHACFNYYIVVDDVFVCYVTGQVRAFTSHNVITKEVNIATQDML